MCILCRWKVQGNRREADLSEPTAEAPAMVIYSLVTSFALQRSDRWVLSWAFSSGSRESHVMFMLKVAYLGT